MDLRLRVDRRAALEHGLTCGSERLEGLPAWAERAAAAGGDMAFLDVPLDTGPAEAVRAWRDTAPAADDVIVVGIGGSALGARVVDALRPADSTGPRLHVVDTVDPQLVQQLMRTLDPSRSCLVVISKSGTTLETGAVFLILESWLERALGRDGRARIAVVSGEEENALRSHADRQGYASFSIPAGVGGRFSALTPVGLLPAALLGVDPLTLIGGAAAARRACLSPEVGSNPALALADVHLAAQEAGRSAAVLWPYGERLGPLGPWWVQLVGESLGKPGPDGPVGVTPVAARGPADQHSLLQLLVEGPDDKLTVFVDAPPSQDGPLVPAETHGLGGAGGHALADLLTAERVATAYALAEAGRPSVAIRLAGADADAVGAFLLTYEMAVVYWGRLLGVNPFGQPGVALGKRAALARLTGEPADLAERLRNFEKRTP